MITESFLNSCFSIMLNKDCRVRKDLALYRDILNILDFYEKKQKIEIPMSIKNKFECLKKVCSMKIDGKNDGNILDSLSISEKYRGMVDFLEHSMNEKMNDEEMLDNVKQVRLRKKLNSIFTNFNELSKFMDSFKNCTFNSLDDVVLDYEEIIKNSYSTMMQANRSTAIEASASLDMCEDNYETVTKTIIKRYERKNTVPTGYQIFDNHVFNGGFESSRLYLIGGTTGAGKSTLAMNCLVNSATMDNLSFYNVPEGDKKNVHVYITMENSIDESLLRAYQSYCRKTTQQALIDINSGVDIRSILISGMKRNKSTVVMKYFPAYTISTTDIMMVLDDIISKYGPDSIRSLYVDYMDKLRTDLKYDLYRIELGQITSSLKNIAVRYDIPVITLTQLNRSAYSVDSGSGLNLGQMSEAMKKVEDADCVILLKLSMEDRKIVHMKVGKNRSGKSEIEIEFNVDFSMFKFESGKLVSNSSKSQKSGDGFDEISKFDF